MIKIFNKINIIFFIFFTNYPNLLKNISNKNSNMAILGIANILITLQIMFWIANFSMILILCFNNLMETYLKLLIFCIGNLLYIYSFTRCFYLTKYIEKII